MVLNQITVPSVDIKKSANFYETLGMKAVVKASPHYARFVCPDGKSTFSLYKVEKLPMGEGVSIYFECDDLDKQVNALVDQGIEFDEMPNDKPWLWREARLRDLDNNQLILYYGGENRLNPPWRVEG